MANISINTQTTGYQTRLTQLREIKQFYGPRIVEYLNAPQVWKTRWREKDPILDELLDIYERIDRRV